jgi:F-type H+-transporting ATPase subunit delta
MSAQRIASRYAKSLIGLSQEKKMLEEVNRDMLFISDTFSNSKELQWIFKNPVISSYKKGLVLAKLFDQKISKLSSLFLQTLCKKEREDFLANIAVEFTNQYNKIHGIEKVNVTSAIALGAESMNMGKNFVEKETGHKAEIQYHVNPQIIGGMIIRFEDQLYDFSIERKLFNLRKDLVNN